MDILISDEQETLVDTVRQWLGDRTDLAAAHADTGDQPLVRTDDLRAAADLGLVGLLRTREGGTHADLALIVEDLGHAASPLPLGQAALVCRALDDAGIGGDTADRVAAGEVLAVIASTEPGGAAIRAGADGADIVLTGTAPYVVGALTAAYVLVAGETGDGTQVLALVAADASGVTRVRRTALDLTRDICSIRLDAVRVGAGDWAAITRAAAGHLADAVAGHHAADGVGAAGRLQDMAVQYVKERHQFGRAVGGFQAVKHHCANMALDVECARVAVRAAARALDGDDENERRTSVCAAASVAGDGCSRAAGVALQLHGGMGFTWEHDLHLFMRRIKTSELLGGTPRLHRERLAGLVI